jgi:hypothetical protein
VDEAGRARKKEFYTGRARKKVFYGVKKHFFYQQFYEYQRCSWQVSFSCLVIGIEPFIEPIKISGSVSESVGSWLQVVIIILKGVTAHRRIPNTLSNNGVC